MKNSLFLIWFKWYFGQIYQKLEVSGAYDKFPDFFRMVI